MDSTLINESPVIDWAVAGRALSGHARSGDHHVVKPFRGGVLVAVLDGLGHGEEAGDASDIGAATLEDHAGEPVESLLKRCHDGLLGTRGVAMTLASIDASAHRMSYIGVGNVEGILVRSNGRGGPPTREGMMLRGGVVGYRLPPLRTNHLSVGRGDTLIMATDGIRSGFIEALRPSEPPQQMADRILARFARPNDDALVLVARILEGGE